MDTILVPTDGSVAAEKALDLAFDLAEKHDARIKVLHILLRDKEPDELLRLPELAAADTDMAEELAALAGKPETPHSAEELMAQRGVPDRPVSEALLRAIGGHVLNRAALRAKARGVSAEALPLGDGAAAEAIASTAVAEDVDTIVMGTRGLRQIEAVAFGSVSQQVCRLVKCTCVAVH
ncbi:MAG: universal stress protein [Hyphomicrobiaceae bacterium]|nr:universal stress protein [Hyphomicrobiaceae bacterium]